MRASSDRVQLSRCSLSATCRLQIGGRQMDAVVSREVVLPATVEEVWQTLVDPEELGVWFDADVEFDARPGGAATFRGDGGVRLGVVEEVEARRRLVYRWCPAADEEETTTVTFTIDAVPSGTRLV